MRWWHRAGALLVLLFFLRPCAAQGGETWLRGAINHVDHDFTALVHTDSAGRQFVRELDVSQLKLPTRGTPTHRFRGEWYFRADALPEHEVHIDPLSGFVHFVSRIRPHISDPPASDLLLDVTVNQRRLDEPLLLHFRNGEIVFSEDALVALGVDQERARLLLRADDALPIHAVAGENFALDFGTLSLYLTMPPELFEPVRIPVKAFGEPVGAITPGTSAIVSYNITSGIDADRSRWNAGLFELAFASGAFSCVSQHIRPANEEKLYRLDSHCTRDWPDHVISLNVGDAITRPGMVGQSVRYGGVRVGTDYSLAPYYLTQPTLALLGSARVPSTLEVWVDQMLALRSEIQPGVFELDDIPVQTGAGEVRAVVTDALGVRQVISQQFYSDPSLLATGLSDWSVELGRLRENYARMEDGYGEKFGLFDYRYGVTDWLTIEPRLEAFGHARVVRMGFAWKLGRLGVVQAEQAVSKFGDDEAGKAAVLRFSRRGRYLSFSVAHETSEPSFVQLGYVEAGSTPAELARASVGVRLGPVSLNLGGFRRESHEGVRQRFHTAAVSVPVARRGHLLFTAFEPVAPAEARLYSMTFTLPFGNNSNTSASAFRQGVSDGWELGVQRNLPSGPGFGYRVSHGEVNGVATERALLQAQNQRGRIDLDARHSDGSTVGHAVLSGSVIASRHGLDLARWQNGSIAVIELPSRGVRVYHDERLAAISDSGGMAIVPGLRSYEVNRLRVEVDDLALNAVSTATDQWVVPGRRQAIAVDFQVLEARWLTARLWQAVSGKPVPAGAQLRVEGSDTIHTVGYDGLIYIPIETSGHLELHIEWPGGTCTSTLQPETTQTFVDDGEVPCG